MKRHYRPNRILKDERLPFELEITSGLTVYYKSFEKKEVIIGGKTTIVNYTNRSFKKAKYMYCERTHKITVVVDEYRVDIMGTDKKGNFVYKIFKNNKELINENR